MNIFVNCFKNQDVNYLKLRKILLYPRNNDIAKDKFKTSWANEFLHNAKTITEKTFQDLGLYH